MTAAPLAQQLRDLVGPWGRPPDDAAKVAIALAAVATLLVLTGRGRSVLGMGEHAVPRRVFLWIAAFSAALLSILYIAIYLRGGPRIIDATTYFMQGRALSHGDLSWPVEGPSGSFRGRFLLYRESGDQGVMGGIFPPGYPLLLAIAFRIGAPMVVGPALAAAIVIATYKLARTLAVDALPSAKELVEPVARAAALVSVVCVALRYHTADTMAHGATALGIAVALDAGLKRRALLAGLAIGAVAATRPVSAVAVGLVVAWVLARRPTPSPRPSRTKKTATTTTELLGRLVIGTLPGVLLLVVAQHSVTGAWLTSSQKMYYALSDGPPGCFRWGLGRGIGCLHEHGDFVAARLASGYGLLAALGTTVRRLRMHLLDVANLEPLALLVLVPLARARGAVRRSPAVVAALLVVLLHVLAYAGFYFDGNYPGGGARFFADVLPIEHALLALAVARLAGSARYLRAAFALVAVVLVGFAVHGVFGHIQLAEREGGKPMYEPDLLARANIVAGLVFVDTDHGFALGHDPSARSKNGIVVARLHNDDRDRMLFDRLEHPPTYLYKFDIPAAVAGQGPPVAVASVVPWAPPALNEPARYEAEAEWPALSQRGGYAVPVSGEACVSGARALALVPSPLEGRASVTFDVPVPQAGRYAVALRVVQGTRVPFVASRTAKLPRGAVTIGKERWEWVDIDGAACADLSTKDMKLKPPFVTVTFEAEEGVVTLDRVSLKRLP
ncbi:MAG TPA: hypothetical protein VLT33_22720 [Labilithrix sp.]|nr:hypothetical protein [Labilithrix sp.]